MTEIKQHFIYQQNNVICNGDMAWKKYFRLTGNYSSPA